MIYNSLISFADHGLEVLTEHISKATFPWLMSNVIDNETGRPLGSGKRSHTMVHKGIKIGFVGLVEKEWLETISTIDIKEGLYSPFEWPGVKFSYLLQFLFLSHLHRFRSGRQSIGGKTKKRWL